MGIKLAEIDILFMLIIQLFMMHSHYIDTMFQVKAVFLVSKITKKFAMRFQQNYC